MSSVKSRLTIESYISSRDSPKTIIVNIKGD
jgi:hypothetical protein